ncbi:metallophosphoesterase family protein [Baekduia soli]|uniref:metallophosphoesterase family protein n=1 Tax=Baekduia soli TaxID=496014 RepID=UPI0016527F39|nr:metallophosphoesterase family protein [Baekduia soli]
MRVDILALYDIHGNVDALTAVLADPRTAGPDAVVVGGDAVPGPFAAQALERLDALGPPVHWVRGNGEREVGAAVGAPAPDPGDAVAVTAALSAAAVGDERARALGALPLTAVLDGVRFCHASPRRDDELLTPLSPPARWAQALEGVTEEALVVAGHTHRQDDRRVGAVRFVNAGSVGLPYEGDGAARWLWIADGTPHLRRTAYDAAGAGARMLEAGWPDEDSVRAALVAPLPADEITRLFEEQARGRARGV